MVSELKTLKGNGKMIIKILNKLLHKYMWVYERDNGDKGFVIAKNRKEAINKLTEHYPDARARIEKTDKNKYMDYGWMYLFHADCSEIHGDVFVILPW